MNDKKMIEKCIGLAKKGYSQDEVPVGCIIYDLSQKKIVGRGYNKNRKHNNPLHHAEVIAIQKACKKKKIWRLDDCILYCTLEPCLMCLGIINAARIPVIIYGTSYSNNKKYNTEQMFEGKKVVNLNSKECSEILACFFKKKRKEKQSML